LIIIVFYAHLVQSTIEAIHNQYFVQDAKLFNQSITYVCSTPLSL